MRLDMFLKVSRLVPRRTEAQSLCVSGAVKINDRPAKPAHAVSVGDVITISFWMETHTYRVEQIPSGKSISREKGRLLVTLMDTKRKEIFE